MEKVAIIGLGYVGLPLAVEFGKIIDVIGFDINKERINELKNGIDRTYEVESDELNSATILIYTDALEGSKKGGYCNLRINCLSRVYRGGLCSHSGENKWAKI